MYGFLYNDFYFNDRFLLVNPLELALRNIYGFFYSSTLCRVLSREHSLRVLNRAQRIADPGVHLTCMSLSISQSHHEY